MRFDEIGNWSELKLEILRKYAAAYSQILASQRDPSFEHVYIDGFCGAGVHVSKTTGEPIEGSPQIALGIEPPFREYFLVDLDGEKVEYLRSIASGRPNVHLHRGDCNQVLLEEVFPQVRYEDYRRGLCLLDPYGLHLDWSVIAEAGRLGTIDLFLNFPIMDMNRNALWTRPEEVSEKQIERMTSFWGDESWREAVYQPAAQGNLFGDPDLEKQENEVIAAAFRQRLKKVAGFDHVAEPLPMRNSTGATVYYLFFASRRPVAGHVVRDIFDKYRDRRS